jgi:hypothetical protein
MINVYTTVIVVCHFIIFRIIINFSREKDGKFKTADNTFLMFRMYVLFIFSITAKMFMMMKIFDYCWSNKQEYY